ncbi:unnamed protein product, partial [Heterotrigona itama]
TNVSHSKPIAKPGNPFRLPQFKIPCDRIATKAPANTNTNPLHQTLVRSSRRRRARLKLGDLTCFLMISLPQNPSFAPSMMPSQNVPVQTSQNFPMHTIAQQMQTTPSAGYPANPQDPFKPFYQLHQADVFVANHQYQPNPRNPTYPTPFQPYSTFNNPLVQSQVNCGALPPNVLDQIRNCVSSAAPIFILPGGCHQQVTSPSQAGLMQQTAQPMTNVNPPTFYPYPVPMPVFNQYGCETHGKQESRGCSRCQKKQHSLLDGKNYPLGCCCNVHEQEEHRCTASDDDTVCSKRNCPASISLQALASQFLSLPGIISCAITRLILRKIPGSSVASSMEDTMDKAMKSLAMLNKEQLLAESRNAQQANALISLHMTTNPPVNIIPLLTLLQLKVNVLKAQVESLINKKVTECQGYEYENEIKLNFFVTTEVKNSSLKNLHSMHLQIESKGPIDPTVLSMKTNAELRQLLAALRAKECDERVNVNFSPYCSQKVIAESRLSNVQAKIRQVEMEFDRRREITVPGPTLTSRIIQQFSESTCTFGFAQARLFEPCVQGRMLDSPDPFARSVRSPKRLLLKACDKPGQRTVRQTKVEKIVATSESGTTTSKDAGTGEDAAVSSKEKGIESKSSDDTCSCRESSSDDSLDGGKKKLRLRIDEDAKMIVNGTIVCSGETSLEIAPHIVEKVDGISGTDYVENKTKEKDNGQVSEIELVDVKEIGNDSGQFQIIATDDHDGNMEGKLDGGGKLSVETETENDVDIKKGVGVNADAWKEANIKEESISAEASVDAGLLIEKESETDSERRKIKKESDEDKDKDNQNSTTVEVKAGSGKQEEAEHKDYVLLVEKEIVLEPEDVESSNAKSSFKRIEEEDGEALKEIVSMDPKDVEESVNETAVNGQPLRKSSSDLYKLHRAIPKPHKSILSKNETNFETPRKSKKGKSVQIVQMMTRVEYDRQFEDSWGWNINERSVIEMMESRCDRKIEDVNVRNETDEGDKYLLPKEGNSFATFGDQPCELVSTARLSTETNDEETKKDEIKIDRNALAEKMFPTSRRTNDNRMRSVDEKMTNGLRRFPPLKYARPNTGGTTTTADISENIFHRGEIGSVSSKIVRDRGSTYPYRHSKMESNIVHAIYSVIENQLVSFNSLLDNLHPNFHRVLPNFRFNRVLSGNETRNGSDDPDDTDENKQSKLHDDDWILPLSSANVRDTSGRGRVSVGEQCDNVRGMRHSIIVEEGRRDYLVIGGSVSRQFRELSRNGLSRPFHTRRTLFVRSRLKDSNISGHEYRPRPFTMFKRSKGSTAKSSRTHYELRSLKGAVLPEISGNVESLNGKRSNDFLTVNKDESETPTQQNSKRANCSIISRNTKTTADE